MRNFIFIYLNVDIFFSKIVTFLFTADYRIWSEIIICSRSQATLLKINTTY